MICSFGSKGRVVKEEELKTDMDQLIAIKTEVMRTIRQVPDPELQLLLEKRYLYHEKLEDIAIDMNISIQHTFRLHGEALKKEEANGKTFDYG